MSVEQLPDSLPDLENHERLGEACGLGAVYDPDGHAAQLAYLLGHAVQHRGQDGAGEAYLDDESGLIIINKEAGLIAAALNNGETVRGSNSRLAMVHTRYATVRSQKLSDIPKYEDRAKLLHPYDYDTLVLGHNGSYTNADAVADYYDVDISDAQTDTDKVGRVLNAQIIKHDGDVLAAIREVVPRLGGAGSLLMLTPNGDLYGLRDPRGFRPLVYGRLENSGYAIASETAALNKVKAFDIQEVAPGEVIRISEGKLYKERYIDVPAEEIEETLCIFEKVYFHRPDSVIDGESIYEKRERAGMLLAIDAPLPADVDHVLGAPESGIPFGQGFAHQSGHRYRQSVVRDRFIPNRSCIEGTQELRDLAVALKMNPIQSMIENMKIGLIDDSIVRGTTHKQLVRMLRAAGAAEVHLRIASPPYRWPCFYGMDTSDPEQLIANYMTLEEIAAYLDVDSLGYLSVDRLVESAGAMGKRACKACFTGEYPEPIPLEIIRRPSDAEDKILIPSTAAVAALTA